MDRFNPPDDLPLAGKIFYWAFFLGCMAAFSYFVLPIIATYVSAPFSAWVGSFF